MRISKLGLAAAAAIGAISLGGCAYDSYGGYGGYGGGYGYAPYGGLSVGVGYGGYYGSPFGWYDDFYYPGTGIYVYDNYRRPHRWSDRQRTYWTQRSGTWHDRNSGTWDHNRRNYSSTTTTRSTRPNWSGFTRTDSGSRHHRR